VKRLKALEEENRRLKTLVADLTLDKQALQHLLGKKMVGPGALRLAAVELEAIHASGNTVEAPLPSAAPCPTRLERRSVHGSCLGERQPTT
jgi:hypothetical protein